MIEKTFVTPSVRRDVLLITPKTLKDKSAVLSSRLLQMREEDGIFTAADDTADRASVNENVTMLAEFCGGVYGFLQNGRFVELLTATLFGDRGNPILCAVPYHDNEGGHSLFIMSKTSLFRFDGSFLTKLEPTGGTCGAVHRERLFIANGCMIRYSEPLSPQTFSLEGKNAGKIELEEGGGEILALVPFDGAIMVFRTREILKLTADARDLNYRFERQDFDCGTILAGSVQKCGDSVVFLTERGLCVCRGGKIALAQPSLGIGFASQSASYGGRYFFRAEDTDGKTRIRVYDPAADTFYTDDAEADAIGGGESGIWYRSKARLRLLAGRGFGSAAEGSLSFTLACGEKKDVRIEGIRVRGEGAFRAEIATEEGGEEVALQGGGYGKLLHTLRGRTVTLCLHALQPTCTIHAVELWLREALV